jgi:glycosyltransferase involved in cell wall biosynthesis
MKVAAVIPCYRVGRHIEGVVEQALRHVDVIYVVDDCCPDSTGDLVEKCFSHSGKVQVIRHQTNQGVGGAVISGYAAAKRDAVDIAVKLDGDGQMDPQNIPALIAPILAGTADYTKGNRFFNIGFLRQMPAIRVMGNSTLSFVNKISSGYWNIMDPTNGFTAIHATALAALDLDKIANRYFFESDMLFRLNIIRAVVRDVPMPAIYGDEESNLKIGKILFDFPGRYLKNFVKRFFYNYVLRDMNIGSIETLIGTVLVVGGLVYGITNWISSGIQDMATPVGTVMLATLPIILGSQLLLSAVAYDIYNVPSEPLQKIKFPYVKRDDASETSAA